MPKKPHGQKSLAGYSPWGCRESDVTEHEGAVSHLESPDLGARAQITRQAVVGAHSCQGFSHLSLSPALLTWGHPFLLPGSFALVRLPQGKVNPGVQGPHPPAPPGPQHRARHRVGAHGEERFSHRLIVKGWRDRSPSLRVRPQTGAHVTLSKAFHLPELPFLCLKIGTIIATSQSCCCG